MKLPSIGKLVAWGGWVVAAATAFAAWYATHPHP